MGTFNTCNVITNWPQQCLHHCQQNNTVLQTNKYAAINHMWSWAQIHKRSYDNLATIMWQSWTCDNLM